MNDQITPTIRVRHGDRELLGVQQRRREKAPGVGRCRWDDFVVEWHLPEDSDGESGFAGGLARNEVAAR